MIELFERVPKINNWESTSNVTITDRMFNGDIIFHKLKFHYPSRPNVTVLDNLMLSIKKGQRVALVGSSGCGKSTVTQLLERFYDSDQGSIYISGFDIRQLNLFWLRSQIGLVSQEPILFDTSIAENIAYGCDDGEINMQKIVYAARQANIHDFIMKLPQVRLIYSILLKYVT
jgi:ABC-type multidrug transport system fused ATPase/permease subunit